MKSLLWISSPTFDSSSVDSSLVVIRYEKYVTAFVAGLETRTDGFLPYLFFYFSWPSFQWNPHALWPLLQEVHHLYFLLLRVMVDVVRSLVSDTTGFLVAHSGSSFVDFLGEFPLETFTFELQSFWIWPLLLHLWQFISDLVDYPLPEPLPFPLRRLLKSTWFKVLLIYCSMDTVYALGSEGWSWYFYLLVAGSHRFESTISRYSRVASCTRDS